MKLRCFPTALAALLCTASLGPAAAAPLGWVLHTNQSLALVDLASNSAAAAGSTPFASDSLAVTPAGALYSADPGGVVWNVTAAPFPAGATQRTQIADLDWAAGGPSGGLWGYSNASQELFFFDLGSGSVTYAAVLTLPAPLSPAAVVTGVAHAAGSGDVFLSAYDGPASVLLRVPAAASSALWVGTLAHGDGASYVADIDFDAAGTLYAMTWFHRHIYTVDPATAITAGLSVGPHSDSTALALLPVPEAPTAWLLGAGLAAFAARFTRARHPRRR